MTPPTFRLADPAADRAALMALNIEYVAWVFAEIERMSGMTAPPDPGRGGGRLRAHHHRQGLRRPAAARGVLPGGARRRPGRDGRPAPQRRRHRRAQARVRAARGTRPAPGRGDRAPAGGRCPRLRLPHGAAGHAALHAHRRRRCTRPWASSTARRIRWRCPRRSAGTSATWRWRSDDRGQAVHRWRGAIGVALSACGACCLRRCCPPLLPAAVARRCCPPLLPAAVARRCCPPLRGGRSRAAASRAAGWAGIRLSGSRAPAPLPGRLGVPRAPAQDCPAQRARTALGGPP